MKIPKKIRIGPSYYTVTLDLMTENLGVCEGHKGTIRISSDLIGERLASTLFHEILHGMIYESHVDGLSEKMEERVVRSLEAGICGFAKDNQKLFIELVKEMGKK